MEGFRNINQNGQLIISKGRTYFEAPRTWCNCNRKHHQHQEATYREKGISLIETDIPKIQPGWEGKQKGMLQILWKWGWINVEHLRNNMVNGKKDALGVI